MAQFQFPKLMALGTNQQRMYVLEYAANGFSSKAKAAKRAGYKNPEKASGWLDRNKKIVAAIEEQRAAAEKSLEQEYGPMRNRVLAELAELAFREVNSVGNLVTWTEEDIRLKSSEELTDEIKGAISRVKVGAYGPELSMYDRGQNLERLARILGLMQPDQAPAGGVTLIIGDPKASAK